MNTDRAIGAWVDLQNLQDPMGLYARMYRAKVVAQDDDTDEVDVRPDDPALPDMAKIPLRHGIPGLRVSVELGSYVLVGWDDGRPDHPFAGLWTRGTVVKKISLVSPDLRLGDRDATEKLVQGSSYRAAEDEMLSGLQAGLTALQSAVQYAYSPMMPGVTAMLEAVTNFIAAASSARGFLSPTVTTK